MPVLRVVPRRKSRAALAVAAVLAAAIMATAAAPSIASGAGRAPSLPQLPSIPEQGLAAGARPGEVPDLSGFKAAYGYVGPWVTSPTHGEVVVLTGTVAAEPGAVYVVNGLVRNETAAPVAHVRMRVTARAADGTVIGVSDFAESPVSPVRATEPAPFTIETTFPANAVATTEFEVAYSTASDDTERMLDLARYWAVGYGQRDAVNGYPLFETGPSPYPAAVFGAVKNASARALPGVTVVGAWFDTEGRVMRVAESEPGPAMPPNASRDFLLRIDDPVTGPNIADDMALWGEGKS